MLWLKKSAHMALPGTRVKLSFRRHALPVLVGMATFLLVFAIFDSPLVTGPAAYSLSERRLLHAQKTGTVPSGKAPATLVISKTATTAPVLFPDPPANDQTFQDALQNGVVHYPGTADPGDSGNVVIVGYSSGQWWAPGNYKFIFTLLDKLDYGDEVNLSYHGTRYTYRVYNRLTVAPTNLSVLDQGGSHMLTLLTCTPVGTDDMRFVVQAQQISPTVTGNAHYDKPAALPASAQGQATLPCAPSFWSDARHLAENVLSTHDVPGTLPNTVDVSVLTKNNHLKESLQKHP